MRERKFSEKEELVAAISAIFFKYGLRSTSMDDVAAQLKISKKSIYKHFENKTELVAAVMRYREDDLMHKWDNLSLENDDVLLLAYMKMYIFPKIFMEKSMSNYYDIKKYYPELHAEFLQKRDKHMMQHTQMFVKNGISQGFFRTEEDVNLKTMLFVKTLKLFSSPENQNFENCKPEDIFIALFDSFLRSISTSKGQDRWNQLLTNKPDMAECEKLLVQPDTLFNKLKEISLL
ncbi:MAG: TetR/AcrR family transcriptional regulator [Bacteroidales bacterium]|nr:TetR/AcrR family transcriptional regulator [Bacteroidales bacterium]